MMHKFLANNRLELTARCRTKVSLRGRHAATDEQLQNGIPAFLGQLIRTLAAEQTGQTKVSLDISGPSGRDGISPSEIGVTAIAHGEALMTLGYSIDQVVHDYGDLCQAITELALDRGVTFAVDEFRTLNRCLDNAIADAVTVFSAHRDVLLANQVSGEANKRFGFLVHEMRNALTTASLSVRAMERGGLTLVDATGSVLKRSLASMRNLVDGSIAEVRARSAAPARWRIFSLAAFVEDAKSSAELEAEGRGCRLVVAEVDPILRVESDRDILLAALGNLMSNAFKFSHRHSEVQLRAFAFEERFLVEVEDRCGGLAESVEAKMFVPFAQAGADRSGLGLGLSIARQNIETLGGTLRVRNLPGVGCVFTIDMPKSRADRRVLAPVHTTARQREGPPRGANLGAARPPALTCGQAVQRRVAPLGGPSRRVVITKAACGVANPRRVLNPAAVCALPAAFVVTTRCLAVV